MVQLPADVFNKYSNITDGELLFADSLVTNSSLTEGCFELQINVQFRIGIVLLKKPVNSKLEFNAILSKRYFIADKDNM